NGAKWFGLNGYGISVLTGNDPTVAGAWTTHTRSSTNQQLASDGIRSIEIDSSGNRWFGTDIKGVCVLDTNGDWTTYDLTNSGLSNNTVKQIKEDPVSGHIWIGTNGGGVCQYDGTTWITFNQDNCDIPSNFVQAIAIDNKTGYRWFGTQEGLCVYIERDVVVEENSVSIQGGVSGYVNPAKGETAKIYFDTAGAGRVSVRIYTLDGSLVCEKSKQTDGNRDHILWDCSNRHDTVVASGVYVLHIEGPGINTVKKIAIVK
ncbi:MAG: T9SS type A sorting domain-containing protein, partial [Elusimicrobiota bacterium]